MVRFRDLRDGWNVMDEESGEWRWKRNEDPMLRLVPSEGRRCVVLDGISSFVSLIVLVA